MPNPRKAVLSVGGNDCPPGPNAYESSGPTASTSGLLPKDKSNGWPGFIVSWRGPRACRRAAKEKLLNRNDAVGRAIPPHPGPLPQGEGEYFTVEGKVTIQ